MLLVSTKEKAYAQIRSACNQLFAAFKFLFILRGDALCKSATVIDDSLLAFESAALLQAFLWKKRGQFFFNFYLFFYSECSRVLLEVVYQDARFNDCLTFTVFHLHINRTCTV